MWVQSGYLLAQAVGTLSLGLELAEFLMHLWCRLEGRRVTVFFFGWECCRGPSEGVQVGGDPPLALLIIH